MTRMLKTAAITLAGLLGLTACSTGKAEPGKSTEPVAAVLTDTSDATMSKLKTALGKAIGRANIELGPGNLTENGIISVLPPRLSPLEGKSPAMPTLFDLMLSEDGCFARNRSTGEDVALDDIACVEKQ